MIKNDLLICEVKSYLIMQMCNYFPLFFAEEERQEGQREEGRDSRGGSCGS